MQNFCKGSLYFYLNSTCQKLAWWNKSGYKTQQYFLNKQKRALTVTINNLYLKTRIKNALIQTAFSLCFYLKAIILARTLFVAREHDGSWQNACDCKIYRSFPFCILERFIKNAVLSGYITTLKNKQKLDVSSEGPSSRVSMARRQRRRENMAYLRFYFRSIIGYIAATFGLRGLNWLQYIQ
jgi:hypothetical protein